MSVILGAYGNATIAASALGTAAATILIPTNYTTNFSTPSLTYARAIEVWNYTNADLDLVVGGDAQTADYVNNTPAGGTNLWYVTGRVMFLPSNRGTAAMAQIRGERYPFNFEAGMLLAVRTLVNTPVTCSAAAPLIINFWT